MALRNEDLDDVIDDQLFPRHNDGQLDTELNEAAPSFTLRQQKQSLFKSAFNIPKSFLIFCISLKSVILFFYVREKKSNQQMFTSSWRPPNNVAYLPGLPTILKVTIEMSI